MYSVDEDYLEAIADINHIALAYLSFGSDQDTTAADDISSITADIMSICNTDQLVDAVYVINPGLAMYDRDGISMELSNGMIAPPETGDVSSLQLGIISTGISDSSNALAWSLDILFTSAHTSAITLYFGSVYAAAFTVTFYSGASVEGVETVTANTEDIWYSTSSHTYTRIVVAVTSISAPYAHISIGEIEFGRLTTIGNSKLVDGITVIREIDPTSVTSPISELDFSLSNVGGVFDADNPDADISMFGKGHPVHLTFSIQLGTYKKSIPMGKFYIVNAPYSDNGNKLSFVCMDIRYTMSTIYPTVTLNTSDSIATQLATLFSAWGISYTLATSLSTAYLSTAHTYAGDTDMLTLVLHIAQLYGLVVWVDRYDTVHVSAYTAYEYGLVEEKLLYTYPRATAYDHYNYITISNDTTSWSYDLRTDTTLSIQVLSAYNPLITTSALALAFKDHIVAGLPSDRVRCKYICDPALDPGDNMKIPTKFIKAEGSLSDLKMISTTMEYKGLLRMTMELMK